MPNTNTVEVGERTQLFGFWGYDQFPYVLGAPGRLIGPDDPGLYDPQDYRQGCFLAEGYGGSAFSNPLTLPLEEGKAIARRLETLKIEYRAARKQLDTDFNARVRQIFPAVRKLWKGRSIEQG